MQAGSGRSPRTALPQAEQSRGCALSLFYASITPASPLASPHSTHTCPDLAAPVYTPCPGTASPSPQCLLHPCWHSPAVQLSFLTGHCSHQPTSSSRAIPKATSPQLPAPAGQAGAQCPQQPIPLPLSPGCQRDHLYPPTPQRRLGRADPEGSPQCMATSHTWTLVPTPLKPT